MAESVAGALAITAEFELAMGWRLNRDKSRQFANTAALRKWLASQTPLIPAGRQFRDLGVVAAAGRVPRCAVAGSRARAAGVRFARIGRLPLEFRHRCMLGAAAGTSAGLYGASCGRPPSKELAGLRAAARQAVPRRIPRRRRGGLWGLEPDVAAGPSGGRRSRAVVAGGEGAPQRALSLGTLASHGRSASSRARPRRWPCRRGRLELSAAPPRRRR